MERWIFEVTQGGTVVAEGSAPDMQSALREAKHYCMMYGQDGEVEAIVRMDEENFEPPTVGNEVV